MNLEERVKNLEERFNQFDKSAYFTLQKDFQVVAKTGVKIGTASSQKLSVYGAVPVTQANAVPAPNAQGVAYNQTDANTLTTSISSIIAALKRFGITA